MCVGAVVVGAIRSGLNMSHANAKCRGKPTRSDKATASQQGLKEACPWREGGWGGGVVCIEQGFSHLACYLLDIGYLSGSCGSRCKKGSRCD